MTAVRGDACRSDSGPAWPSLAAAARYEYLMQVRRPAVWVVPVLLIALTAWTGPSSLHTGANVAAAEEVGTWAVTFNTFAPLGVGVLLADRARRETRLDLVDLLGSTPSGVGARWWGKALGSASATITPIACCWAVLLSDLAAQRGPGVIPIGVAAFLAVTLPGLIVVAACSLALPVAIGLPLYRTGFVGYWFWGNLLNPKRLPIPTLAGTPFEAIGEYASGGWFGGAMFEAPNRGVHPGAVLAASNVAFLIAAALAVLIVTHQALNRRKSP